MTPDRFTEWTQLHADLFGLRDASDARLFILWAPILMPFTFEELRDASLAVASSPDDRRRWRENHLAMLREIILGKRAEAAARERERLDRQFATGSDCINCHGTGLVRVPHPAWVLNDEIERLFFIVVACECALGIARFNHVNQRLTVAEAEHRLIDLTAYEMQVPDWRRILAAHEEARTKEFEAIELARKVDRIAPIDPDSIKKFSGGRA